MVTRRSCWLMALGALLLLSAGATAQQAGSIRGLVYDKDFDAPLALARVLIVETGQRVTATEEGNFVFNEVPPGEYTLVFSKEGYARQVKPNVVVSSGQLTEVNASLSGEFTEMEEFIVQELEIGGGTEAGLLRLRLESPALIDSVSAELMSQAGAGDAASALKLVSGATVQEGKFAVIRGLPDRYVSSQMNSVRLPTADVDKRAVQLDQFPSAVIESIQVSKTFTPDQQGDASGGAVNVVLKGIPEETIVQFKAQGSYNSQVSERTDFVTYDGGGVGLLGDAASNRDIASPEFDEGGRLIYPFGGAAGVTRGEAPVDYKWSVAAGSKREVGDGVIVGGFGSFFYERDSSFDDNAIDDSYWVVNPGEPMVPRTSQGTVEDGDFKTSLFDVTKGTQLVQWGGLITAGVEIEDHTVDLAYLYTKVAEDSATLAEDTRGKSYYFPGFDPNDPHSEGNTPTLRDAAPYIRTETLRYTERTTETLQFHGHHRLPFEDFGLEDFFVFRAPEVDWRIATSSADLYEPDKRQFGTLWLAPTYNPGVEGYLDPFIMPAIHRQYKPAATFALGNFQRIWKEISEASDQYTVHVKLPFEQWSGDQGYVKLGVFEDRVRRTFDLETFSNFLKKDVDGSDYATSFQAPWETFWSARFPTEEHPITAGPPYIDVDYRGNQEIEAVYYMLDLPLITGLNVLVGARWETTDLSIVNIPEEDATWFPEGAVAGVKLNPGDADVAFEQKDVLPSFGFVFTPVDWLTLRGSYSETVARQTFKELTPILQQEFLGGPIFIGNPLLQMSALRNHDLRLDYTPYDGGLVSISWFDKDITDPIEYVQRPVPFTYTRPVNYPEGELSGVEVEIRQQMGEFWDLLEGLSVGANATFIDSEVILPEDEAEQFTRQNIDAPMTVRDMTNAPEHLYNLYLTYDLAVTGTQIGVFYTIRGDTLIAGAGVAKGEFVPSVYETEFDSLNVSVSQKIGKYLKLTLQAKNLTDPTFDTVYRSEYIGSDVLKTSTRKGIDYSISLSAQFVF